MHLGKALDDAVGLLQQLARLGDGDPRQRRRHVEQVAFVERRHELRAEAAVRPPGDGDRQRRAGDDAPAQRLVPQDELDHRMVDRDEQAVQRVALLRQDAAADEVAHQHRRQGDGEERRRRHGVRLGERQRLEQPSFLRLQREHRDEAHGDDEQRVEQRRADLDRRVADDLPVRLAVLVALDVLVDVLDHDDDRVDHRADGDGDAAEAHDVGADALHVHDDERQEHRHRQRQDRHQRAAEVEEEGDADDRHGERLLEELLAQRGDGALDERRPIVGDLDLHALRQPALQLRELGLDALDHLERVGAGAHDDDAADGLALAVPVGDAAAHVRSDDDRAEIGDQDRRAVGPRADRRLRQLARVGDVALGAQDVLGLRHLHDPAADLVVGALDHLPHLAERDVVGAQLLRIDGDLVLLHVAADAGDLGDAVGAGQLVLQVPVLDAAQLLQVAGLAGQRVDERPADAGGVGPERRRHGARQLALQLAEILEHAAARPVEIGAVLEDHVDEREVEEAIAAHHLGERHRQHLGGDRVGDLVLDDARRLAGILGEDDDLHVGEIGNGVERRVRHRVVAADGDEHGHEQREELVVEREGDDALDHGALTRCPRRAVCGGAGVSFWLRLRLRHRDQRHAADRTLAGPRLVDERVLGHRTGPVGDVRALHVPGVAAHRHQRHAAERTLAGLVVENVAVPWHRADVVQLPFGGGLLRRLGMRGRGGARGRRP